MSNTITIKALNNNYWSANTANTELSTANPALS